MTKTNINENNEISIYLFEIRYPHTDRIFILSERKNIDQIVSKIFEPHNTKRFHPKTQKPSDTKLCLTTFGGRRPARYFRKVNSNRPSL